MNLFSIILPIVVAVLSFIFGYLVFKIKSANSVNSAKIKAANIISDAEINAKRIIEENEIKAKEETIKIKGDADEKIREQRVELKAFENRINQKEESLKQKEENLNKKISAADKKYSELNERIERFGEKEKEKERELNEIINKQNSVLENISSLTTEQAKQLLLSNTETQIKTESANLIKNIVEQANVEADKKAKEIIIEAIQRTAAEHTQEATISTVDIPNDEMKGRIIGREGRNIRAFEQATGVDVVIDDTPEVITLSSFDPLRRHIAGLALKKLISDGRIHPSRIESVLEKAQKEVAKSMIEAANNAVLDTSIGNIHHELLKLLGRLNFRTSFGQNTLKHSVEVSHLAGLMASELNLDTKVAKRAGLLHDIGKALDHEVEGTHVDIGIDVLRKFGESEEIIDAMKSHHGDYEPASLEAVLIQAADALSAARPGARSEILDSYVKRIKRLEDLVNSIDGVESSYALQAGREIRVVANPDKVNDSELVVLAREITEKIKNELKYPGQIKVNLIREKKIIDYAK